MSVFQSIKGIFQTHAAGERAFVMPERLNAPQGFAQISLRPITEDDQQEWNDVRWGNRDWLAPWESGDPMSGRLLSFNEWVRRLRAGEEAGTGAVFLIEYQMRIVGQISIGAISYGSLRTGMIGYWVARDCAGRGFAPLAVAMLADWAFRDPTGPRLHRIEIAILPENERSRRVVAKLGLTYEGIRRRYMFIGGQWRDHETYSLLSTDQPGSLTARLR
ncbi:GNAT family N-acetyltransferase [Bifidobacterium moraviense]|uniref:GNAT family N-acetyltransferase n=1 Tax=Bifidobacterium moraviense TaxID=2675323 RepID=UPI003AA9DD27